MLSIHTTLLAGVPSSLSAVRSYFRLASSIGVLRSYTLRKQPMTKRRATHIVAPDMSDVKKTILPGKGCRSRYTSTSTSRIGKYDGIASCLAGIEGCLLDRESPIPSVWGLF